MSAATSRSASPHILALVTDAFGGHGGIALYMRDVLRCLAARQDKPAVTLIARSGRTEGVEVPASVRWELDALKGKTAFAGAVLKSLLRKDKPRLILCGHINLLPLARLAAVLSRAPLVLFIYGIDAWKPPRSRIARGLVSSADLILSISEITRQRFLDWSGFVPQKVSLLPNAIKLERYDVGPKNPELLARYGIEGKTVLMTLGRLSAVQRHKGVDEVIDVLPRLLSEIPDLVYLVAGEGDDIPRLRKKADERGVGERVIFTGLVEESEKADHYRLADAFALTGRGDGFGFVLLEAMACGVPVAASVLDGSQEAVLNGELGVLVNPDDPASLTAGLAKVLRQPKGIPAGLAHFAYDRFCSRLQAALEPLMEVTA
jgi:glycosyltransferase involved in cell wall biosynthesis